MRPPSIVVVGSLNRDLTFRVETLPEPGETIGSLGFEASWGGKGANQALAAKRAGGSVSLIGGIGSDAEGKAYLDFLKREGLGVDGIIECEGRATGFASICVDAKAENTIVVHPGANHAWSAEHLEDCREALSAAEVLLAQLECPLACVRRARHRSELRPGLRRARFSRRGQYSSVFSVYQ